jgi:hypothetical protein
MAGDRSARLWLACLAATLIAGGVVGASLGSHKLRWGEPPRPPAWAAHGRLHGNWTGRPLARSEPELLAIPRIKIRAHVIPLGLNSNGTAAVPPLSRPFQTSWFDRGPAPGQRGTAVVFGHVDAEKVGPAVFYRIGALRPGDLIYVTLRDHAVAAFRVYAVALYRKSEFPTSAVYGYTRRPTLRLITCGGTFDRRTRHYLGNLVVFARFAGARS